MDDPTATVTAQSVDTNGNTNLFNGIVSRDGNFWVENLPLNGGTNYLSLMVTNAAGKPTMTNITVFSSTIGLTITMPSEDLWNPTVTVDGTIDSSDYTVWVNGVEATPPDEYGNWEADNVPMTPGGTAVIQARAIPNSNNGGNGMGGSGGGPVTYDNLGNPDPAPDIDTELQIDKPAEVYVYSLHQDRHEDDASSTVIRGLNDDSEGQLDTTFAQETWSDQNLVWTNGAGGTGYENFHTWWRGWSDATNDPGPDFNAIESNDWQITFSTNLTYTREGPAIGGTAVETYLTSYPNGPGSFEVDTNNYGAQYDWESCNVKDFGSGSATVIDYSHLPVVTGWTKTYTRTAQTILHLRTGGKGKSRQENLFQISGSASRILDNRALPELSGAAQAAIPSQNITILNQRLGIDGSVWMNLPNDIDYDVTPCVPCGDFYTFNCQPAVWNPYIKANGVSTYWPFGPKFCVGQPVMFSIAIDNPPASYIITNVTWSFIQSTAPPPPGGTFVNDATNAVPGGNWPDCSTNWFYNSGLFTTNPQPTCYWVSGGSPPSRYQISVDFHLLSNGQDIHEQNVHGTFQMYRPVVFFGVYSCGPISLTNYIQKSGTWLYLGAPDFTTNGIIMNQTSGIVYFLTPSPSDWVDSNSFPVIQVIKGFTIQHCQTNGTSIHESAVGLDDGGWGTYQHAVITTNNYGSITATYGDSPGEPCYDSDYRLFVTNSFRTTLMYQPTNASSIAVPLGYFEWSWSGIATNNATNHHWTLLTLNQSSATNV